MKQCAICGHSAERGSICQACRAAIKRARDRTVSEFQSVPAGFALASSAVTVPAAAHGRAAALRPPSTRPSRSARAERREPNGAALLEVPTKARSAPFIWVIVTLMVFVVTFVAYGVISRAIEAGSLASAPAEPPVAKEPSPPSEPPALVVAPPTLSVAAPVQSSETPGDAAPEPANPRKEVVAPARDGPGADLRAHSAIAARAVSRPGGGDSPRSAADAQARPVTPPTRAEAPITIEAPPPRSPVASTPAPVARAAETPRLGRWDRMAAEIRSCAGKDFLGGFVCEQKVRLDYCEGYWGQVSQCPGNPPLDHGQ